MVPLSRNLTCSIIGDALGTQELAQYSIGREMREGRRVANRRVIMHRLGKPVEPHKRMEVFAQDLRRSEDEQDLRCVLPYADSGEEVLVPAVNR